MLPLYDNIPTRRTPVAVATVMCVCVAVFIAQLLADDAGRDLVARFGFVPARLLGTRGWPAGASDVPLGATLITYALFHNGWLHLLGNLLYLWIFADNVEDATGHPRFMIFFLLCCAVAALAHAWAAPNSVVPIIGASGGVSGVLGAYLLLHPRAEISIAVPALTAVRIVALPAWVVLSAWFVFNFALDLYFGSAAFMAFRAHIGGFVAGIVLITFFAPELRAAVRARLGAR